jgi:hypothetical protein
MRWDALFEDLSGRLDEVDRRDWEEGVAALVRAEQAAVHLVDRMVAAPGPLTVHLVDGEVLHGVVDRVGAGWFLLDERSGRVLVQVSAVCGITGLGRETDPDDGGLVRRVSVAGVLRRLAEERAEVGVRTVDGRQVRGVVVAVGADHLDLYCRPDDDGPGRGAVRVIPTAAVSTVRRW